MNASLYSGKKKTTCEVKKVSVVSLIPHHQEKSHLSSKINPLCNSNTITDSLMMMNIVTFFCLADLGPALVKTKRRMGNQCLKQISQMITENKHMATIITQHAIQKF